MLLTHEHSLLGCGQDEKLLSIYLVVAGPRLHATAAEGVPAGGDHRVLSVLEAQPTRRAIRRAHHLTLTPPHLPLRVDHEVRMVDRLPQRGEQVEDVACRESGISPSPSRSPSTLTLTPIR